MSLRTEEKIGSKEGQALRYNGEKVQMDRLPLDTLVEVAKVLQKSSKKYPDNPDGTHNWESLWSDETDKVLRGCILRHLTEIQLGEENDVESGLSHYAHLACNALFGIRYHLNKEKERVANKARKID